MSDTSTESSEHPSISEQEQQRVDTLAQEVATLTADGERWKAETHQLTNILASTEVAAREKRIALERRIMELEADNAHLIAEVAEMRGTVEWEQYKVAQERSHTLRQEVVELTKTVQKFERDYAEEYKTVARVWRALGITTYAEAGGKEVSELVGELKQRNEELGALVDGQSPWIELLKHVPAEVRESIQERYLGAEVIGPIVQAWKDRVVQQENRIHELEEVVRACDDKRKNSLIVACQMAYRKHVLDDDRIGWNELGDRLQTVLCESLGDPAFQAWLATVRGER
jgi:hypothetical protein